MASLPYTNTTIFIPEYAWKLKDPESKIDLPLKNVYFWKLPDTYWTRRYLHHFPSLHSKPKVITVHPSKDVYGEEQFNKKLSGKQPEKSKIIPSPQMDINLPLINYFQPESSSLSSYIEELVTQYFEEGHIDTLNELLKLYSNNIFILRLPNIHISKRSTSESSNIHRMGKILDPSDISSQLLKLKKLELRFVPPEDSAVCVIPLPLVSKIGSTLSSSITEICLFESSITDDVIASFLDSLPDLPFMEILDFRHNLLTCASCTYLKDIMLAAPLKQLKLQQNNIGVKGASILGLGFKLSKTIEIINLDLNPIQDKGANEILKAVVATRVPKYLSLAGCQIKGDIRNFWEYIEDYCTKSEPGHYLSLAGNTFTKETITKVYERLPSNSNVNLLISSTLTPITATIKYNRETQISYFTPNTNKIVNSLMQSAKVFELPKLEPKLLHGIRLKQASFKLEEEIMMSCLHNGGKFSKQYYIVD